ncbi:hypothetical protein ACFY78_18665 [Streptomyces olindensis]|uniref:hypothetical protein n=1 Tax=Streptomyces olindensis TaxID=358823 RepID=UPI00367926EB
MPTRHFTIAELAAINVPPDDPRDIEYDEYVLADEQVTVLKYTAQRRCVFRADDDKTYAVEYEAVEVEEREVTVMKWLPVD